MCVFTNDKDIPPSVRLSTRTLQYLVIPIFSAAILIVGILHLHDCPSEPLLPVWHVVAGITGLLVPLLYLLFDVLNPALAKNCPQVSELLDNVIVFILPVYILFEVAWLITGTVWLLGINPQEDACEAQCDKTIYIFSVVVVVNFWIHILTPLLFMLCICCSRIFPFLGYCTYWKILKNAMDVWTLPLRMGICCLLSLPLGISMVGVGGTALSTCDDAGLPNITLAPACNSSMEEKSLESLGMLDMIHIPLWLVVAGIMLTIFPLIYYLYDAFCKPENVAIGSKSLARLTVVMYLLAGLAWAVTGFVWIFGAHIHATCGQDSDTYKFAFASLILLNIVMDAWICFKICVVLYWALLTDD